MESNSYSSLGIGNDVVVRISGGDGAPPPALLAPAPEFEHPGPAALNLVIRPGGLPDLRLTESLLRISGSWTVHRRGESHVFVLYTGEEQIPYEMAVIDFEAEHGELFVDDHHLGATYPFEFPLSELIFSKLLAHRGGLIVHAGGGELFGSGVLFAGPSGAGKSTLAELFEEAGETRILSDDRIAAYWTDSSARMSGTPWHGTARFASPASLPLDCLLLLRHGSQNELQSLSPAQATAQLLAHSVVPYWDNEATQLVVDTAQRLAESIPAYEFAFVPDVKGLDDVRAILSR